MIAFADAFWYIIKAVIAYLIYDRFLRLYYLRWLYGRRGVKFMSVVPLPFVGDALGFIKRSLAEPDRPHMTKWFRESFDAVPSCIGTFKPTGLQLIITDADYLQDMYRKYNHLFTKHDYGKRLMSCFGWNSLIWSKSAVPSYKPRRRLISHAFYSSKLNAMSDTIFDAIYSRLI